VVLDRPTVATGSAALCEIELELERGKVAELFTVARELVHVLPARVAVKSKSERGYEIINGEQESPIKASHVDCAGRCAHA
jgi:triphosphatase